MLQAAAHNNDILNPPRPELADHLNFAPQTALQLTDHIIINGPATNDGVRLTFPASILCDGRAAAEQHDTFGDRSLCFWIRCGPGQEMVSGGGGVLDEDETVS